MSGAWTGFVGVFVVAFACAFTAAPAFASSLTLNVGPHGSGSTCSSADPCSLQTGLDAVTSASDAYVIDLAPGTYPAGSRSSTHPRASR